MTEATPFERDIAEQPAALRRLADTTVPSLAGVVARGSDRIVLTGMGSSHFASIPTWRALVAQGLPAWAVDAGRLLDSPALLTPRTLLIITSQSGASGEAIELLRRRASGELSPCMIIGIADDEQSPLAQQSDLFLPLHSGPESTVSTKSYLNTLGVHRHLIAAFAGEPLDAIREDLRAAADSVERLLGALHLDELGRASAQHPKRRLAYVGWGDEGATAMFAGLITKESSKVAAEGFIGGQFRHGPFELAGEGLTAVLFGADLRANRPGLLRIGAELVESGARVALVGSAALEGATSIAAPGRTRFEALATGAVVAEALAVALAVGNGYVPGAFLYGSKITTAL
jgi:glucosamine--fructose-6-phosphate aminotransferase (isomerizing)